MKEIKKTQAQTQKQPKKQTLKRTKRTEGTGIVLGGGKKVKAHITGVPSGEAGVLSVTWEVWQSGVCLDRAVQPRRHKYDPRQESFEAAIRMLVAKAEDAWREEYRGTVGTGAHAAKLSVAALYSQALQSLTDEEQRMLRRHTWGDNTWERYQGSLRRICRKLDGLQGEITPDNLCKIRDELLAEAQASKINRGHQIKTINQMLQAMSFCLETLVEIVNEREDGVALPRVPIEEIILCGKVVQYEQIKWIPTEILARLVHTLLRMADNGMAMGVALMLLLGLRTSEACAALFGDFVFLDGWITLYPVRFQGPERNPVLKSNNAYRWTFSGQLLTDLINARKVFLRDQGYSEEEILVMPVVSLPDDPTKAAKASSISDWARSLLLLCGYHETEYFVAARAMQVEPDYEIDGRPMVSVSAYIFRRCFATLLCNCCDLSPGSGIEDYLLGHKHQKKYTFDPNNADIIRVLAARMERLVLHPLHSNHPLYRPVVIDAEEGCDVVDHCACTLTAAEDMEAEITVQTCEPNGTVRVVGEDLTRRMVSRQKGMLDVVEERAARPVVLMPTLPGEFDQYLQGADEIDISTLYRRGQKHNGKPAHCQEDKACGTKGGKTDGGERQRRE